MKSISPIQSPSSNKYKEINDKNNEEISLLNEKIKFLSDKNS